MTMNIPDQKKALGDGDGKDRRFPLEMYIKKVPTVELSVDFSTLGQFPLSEDDLTKLQEIKALVKSAEEEINTLASKTSQYDGEIFHMEQPSYFDENFDQDKYVRDLVNAKFQGMRIIEHESAATKVQKIIMLKKAMDRMNDEDSESSETITIHKSPSMYHVKMENNITTNKNSTVQSGIDSKQANNEIETKSENVVKLTSIVDNGTRTEDKLKRISKSNHKIIEIKSMEAEKSSKSFETHLTVSKIPGLTVEVMPSINIRSQLIEQKIPSLDIFPTDKNNSQPSKANNIALVNTEYQDVREFIKEIEPTKSKKKLKENIQVTTINRDDEIQNVVQKDDSKIKAKNIKKGTQQNKMKTFPAMEKQDSADKRNYMFLNREQNDPMFSEMLSRKISRLKKYGIPEIQQIYNPKTQIYKRCPTIFSRPMHSSDGYLSNISKQPVFLSKDVPKYNVRDHTLPSTSQTSVQTKLEYIPYSKLTLGGHRAEDVERNIKMNTIVPNDNGESLNDDECDNEDPAKTSDDEESASESGKSEANESLEKYMDDFDVDSKTENSEENLTYKKDVVTKKKKVASLSFKSEVDVFDFVNYIETKDDSTQSSPVKNVSFRETQTSPEQENEILIQKATSDKVDSTKSFVVSNITIADMIEIQKVLSALNIQFPINIQSGGSVGEEDKNSEHDEGKSDRVLHVPTSKQKDTQTSPLKSKHVMTSPAKVIRKTPSPIVDAGTSALELESPNNDEGNQSPRKVVIDYSNVVPGSSRQNTFILSPKKSILKESTDAFTDISQSESSESQSLGEINLRILKRRSFTIKKQQNANVDSTSTSFGLSSSSDAHLDSSNYHNVFRRSDGEMSEGQILKNA